MTQPIKEILPRNVDPQLKEILARFSDFLDEIVNYSTHVFKWCIDNVKKGDEHVPVFQTYRHILDLADSVSILIRESCSEPSNVLLRGIFEALLSVEYILKTDTEKRGKDFLIYYKHHRLRILRRNNPDDEMYKEFTAILEKDKMLSAMNVPVIPDIKERIESYSRIFALPAYAESEKEYNRIKRKNKHPPKWWFNMHGGPGDLQELSHYLGRPAQYEILYRQLSDIAHGIDIMEGKIASERPGEVSITQLRSPDDAQFITTMTAGFALFAMFLFINQYAKERLEDWRKWYGQEIQARYLELSRRKIIEVV